MGGDTHEAGDTAANSEKSISPIHRLTRKLDRLASGFLGYEADQEPVAADDGLRDTLRHLVQIQKRLAACLVWNDKSDLNEFGRIYASASRNHQKLIRWEIDSNLIFSTQSHIDFLYIMSQLESKYPALFHQCMPRAEKLGKKEDDEEGEKGTVARATALQRSDTGASASSARSWGSGKSLPSPFQREKRYYALLSDVDDTLLPSSDALNFGGCDESWRKDGTLYPGLSELHRILRGNNYPNNQPGSRGYSTCLTARPVSLTYGLKEKFRRLGPRLGILPGAIYDNMTRDEKIRYKNYANHKLLQFQKYMRLFEDEHFIFFGDNGQGDVMTAEEMLKYKEVAFCCIHIVEYSSDDGDLARGKVLKRVSVRRKGDASTERLFFYHNIDELAYSLQAAGWITYEECTRVHNAYLRDIEAEEANWCISERDAINLEAIITIRNQDDFEDMDEWEREQVRRAKKFLPMIQRHQCPPIYIDAVIIRDDLVMTIHVIKFVKNVQRRKDADQKTRSFRESLTRLARKALTHRICIRIALCRGSQELFGLGKAASVSSNDDNVYMFAEGLDHVLMSRAHMFRHADRFSVSVTREQLGYWTESRIACNSVPTLPMLEAREYLGPQREERLTWEVYSPKVGKETEFVKGEIVVDVAWRTKEEVNQLIKDARPAECKRF